MADHYRVSVPPMEPPQHPLRSSIEKKEAHAGNTALPPPPASGSSSAHVYARGSSANDATGTCTLRSTSRLGPVLPGYYNDGYTTLTTFGVPPKETGRTMPGNVSDQYSSQGARSEASANDSASMDAQVNKRARVCLLFVRVCLVCACAGSIQGLSHLSVQPICVRTASNAAETTGGEHTAESDTYTS